MSKKQIADYEKLKDEIIELFFKEYDKLFPIEKNLDETIVWMKTVYEWNQLFETAYSDVQSTLDLISEMEKNVSKKQNTLMNVFLYLLIAEALICNIINFVSYLLVLDGHDLFSINKKDYVGKNITEITKVETSTKTKFLKNHGFEELVENYDSKLRNKIAHHNYFIDSEGKLWSDDKEIDLETKIKNLEVIIEFINDVFMIITKKLRTDERLR